MSNTAAKPQKPWHQAGDHTLYLGDCLEELRSLPDDSVDLVIASPPYEKARTYSIDFNFKGQEWVDWAVERFLECYRVCKGLTVWVVEGQTRNFRWSATPALLMADLHRAGVKLRNPPAFHRIGICGSGGPDYWRNDYEFCVVASHGKLPWSDNTACGRPPKYAPGGEMSHRLSDGTRRNQWGGSPKSTGGERKQNGELRQAKPRPSHAIHTKRDINGEMQEQTYIPPAIANPGNWIAQGDAVFCNVGKGHMGNIVAHENEAPFPESLVEPFILSFCPPGGTVLDCFGGSGTTAAVAKRLGRKSISIDCRESQLELITRRLGTVQQHLFT